MSGRLVLKPQDLLVALKATLLPTGGRMRFATVAAELGLSRSEVHAAVSRAVNAKLLMRVAARQRSLEPHRFGATSWSSSFTASGTRSLPTLAA